MLDAYREKRDFNKTAEPEPSVPEGSSSALRFVVQKHAASRLHYDFRLEASGALKSWAVPKGPSMNPKDKHLAVMVEDHPIDYAKFEGVIPKGEYGGGEVIVWDEGTYQPKSTASRSEAESAVLAGIEEGKLHFTMFGHKLHGEFVLARMHGDDPNNWLLMKVHDDSASEDDLLARDESVLSGRTIEDVRTGVSPRPSVYSPMLASESAEPFDDPHWQFELKLDGVRAIAIKQNGDVRLVSRNGNELGEHLGTTLSALRGIERSGLVLDGELVFFDEDGKASFQQLMRRIRPDSNLVGVSAIARPGRIEYCVFDILRLDDRDLRDKALRERRAILESLQLSGPQVRVIDSYPEHGKLLYETALKMGFEGVMAKKLTSKYEPGRRSRSWLKIKGYHSEEFVIGGFTRGNGAREGSFGGLLLGSRDDGGELRYAGKVGGGFSDSDLSALRVALDKLKAASSPFTGKVLADGPATWVEPKLVAEVKFMTRTEDGLLRFPTFLRLRPDREASLSSSSSTPINTDLTTQLEGLGESGELELGEHKVKVTHLSKVLWHKAGIAPEVTKRDLLRYYIQLSVEMLPFLKDRPISFVRHPDGIDAPGFFQKHPLPSTPSFVERVCIWSEHSSEALEWVMCNNLETLVWLGQVGTVEIHPWYSRIVGGAELPVQFETREGLDESALDFPDFVVLDLDPNIGGAAKSHGTARAFDKSAWDRTVRVALALRAELASIQLKAWVKSSGKMGLHLYVPLELRYHYDQVKAIAETLGQAVEKKMPEDVTMVWAVKNRPQGVFIDHNQNVRGKTLACPYSPRVAPGASVSCPISWEELETFDPTSVTIFTAFARVAENGNPWRGILDRAQSLVL